MTIGRVRGGVEDSHVLEIENVTSTKTKGRNCMHASHTLIELHFS